MSTGKGLPKFLRTIADGTPNDGTYIIHTREPRCVGEVVWEGDKLRVYMRQRWDDKLADTAAELKMCLEMKNWYYFKYVAPPPTPSGSELIS